MSDTNNDTNQFATKKIKEGNSFALKKAMMSVIIQMGWVTPEKVNGAEVDIDLNAFWLTKNSKKIPKTGTTYALSPMNEALPEWDPATETLVGKNKRIPGMDVGPFCLQDMSLLHYGDALSGSEEENDVSEQILAHLNKAPEGAEVLEIWITIDEPEKTGHHFGLLQSGFIRVINARNENDEKVQYDLKAKFDEMTAIRVASFIKNDDGTWDFHALGQGHPANFGEMVGQLGF